MMTRMLVLVAASCLLAGCGLLSPTTVQVNDGPVVPVRPGDGVAREAEFFIDSAQLRVAESSPPQLFVDVEGNAPTPCHKVVWEISEGDAVREVEIFTETDGQMTCADVLQPHSLVVELGTVHDLPVEVWVNGELLGVVED